MELAIASDLDRVARRAAVSLWTDGRTGNVLPSLLATLPDPLPAPAVAPLRAFTRAVENDDPLLAADVLLGDLVPALGGAPAASPASAEVRVGADGVTRRRASIVDPEAELAAQLAYLPSGGPVLLLGAAHSRLARALSRRAIDLIFWECDDTGHAAAQAVARDAIARVRLLSPLVRDERGPRPVPGAAVFVHPSLQGDDRDEARGVVAWTRVGATRRAGFPARTRPLRVALLHRGRPFHGEAEWQDALGQAGHAVTPVDATALERAVLSADRGFDVVFCVNGAALVHRPEMAALLEHAQVPVALWFVDDPELALGVPARFARPNTLALAWERQAVARLRAAGFAAHYLPHGTALTPPRSGPGRAGIHWVAASYAGRDRQELATAAPADATSVQLRDMLGEALLADRRLSPNVGVAALAALTAETSHLHRSEDRRFLQATVADEVAAARRAELATRLAPLGLTIHGDVEGWERARTGAVLRAHVEPRRRGEVYAAAAVNLDLVHPQMPTALSQRGFDVPGAGGLLLADDRADLRDHFEVGREVLAFDSTEEAAERADWALRSPSEAARIAAAGARRARLEHSMAHRARALLRLLREHFG